MNNLKWLDLRKSTITDPVFSNSYYSSFLFASWDSQSCMVMDRDSRAPHTLISSGNMTESTTSIIKTETLGTNNFN